jgi:hypothetical protein
VIELFLYVLLCLGWFAGMFLVARRIHCDGGEDLALYQAEVWGENDEV